MMRSLTTAAALALLAGCSPANHGPEKVLGTFKAPADYALTFRDSGADARLNFGGPNPDDVQLWLSCYDGSGRIMVSDFWEDGVDVTVRSGQVQASFGGKSQEPGEAGPWVDFWARTESPPLAAFRTTGELVLVSGKRTLALKARPNEMPAVEAFFAACEAKAR